MNVEDTHETLKNLDDTTRARFVAFQGLFETDGWRMLVEYAEAKALAALHEGANAQTWEHNRYALGVRAVWSEVANLETQFMNEFRAIAEQAKQSAEDSVDEVEDFQ